MLKVNSSLNNKFSDKKYERHNFMKCQNCKYLIQFLKINGYKNIMLLEKYIYDD